QIEPIPMPGLTSPGPGSAFCRGRFPYNPPMPEPASFFRPGGRTRLQLRPLSLVPGFVQTAEGSVLVSLGNTRVLTHATIEPAIPGRLRNSGRGWVTAEY